MEKLIFATNNPNKLKILTNNGKIKKDIKKHVIGYNEAHQKMGAKAFSTGNNPYEEYNTYGLEWTEDEYIFYVNGVETVRSTFGNGVSQVEEDVIVSLEIPDPDELAGLDKETYKTEFVVDYVKIYQK